MSIIEVSFWSQRLLRVRKNRYQPTMVEERDENYTQYPSGGMNLQCINLQFVNEDDADNGASICGIDD